MFKCPKCGEEAAYVLVGDDQVREFDRQFNAVLESVNWLAGRANQSDRVKERLRALLEALTDLCTQWNETVVNR